MLKSKAIIVVRGGLVISIASNSAIEFCIADLDNTGNDGPTLTYPEGPEHLAENLTLTFLAKEFPAITESNDFNDHPWK